ncbi:dihydrofolate reductase family protein [Phytoactinopolyspora endophytica]|uniref:dihydrofolate reductase family protein n=1 Tax=Phytoactinopolyspora endophytica TaxID=1642495 RepID=UPI00101B765D|nr:dihydrofolate reductase family protein [Phytoactinopolyspora endophytica]
MSQIVLYMSMSLDGFITGPNDGPSNGLGDGGEILHAWLRDGSGDDPTSFRPSDDTNATVFDESMSTGAVICGKRLGEFVNYWDGDHHDGVPIFVPTHRVPDEKPPGDVRFVTDGIESCVEQAKAAAGDRDVMLHGAYTAQECLRARVLDVMEIHLIPVLLGQGRRLFDRLGPEHIELEPARQLQGAGVLHLRYEVKS